MAFEDIKPIQRAKEYLEIAIKKANKKAAIKKIPKQSRFDKVKTIELLKIDMFRGILVDKLLAITFPKAIELTEFYSELLEITIGRDEYVRAIAKIEWTTKRINEFFKLYNRKIKNARELDTIYKFKNQFYGRTSSVVRELDRPLRFLEQTRKIMQSFPTIKSRMEKIAIAGFPNVGKTTLLKKLTGSRAEVASYAFTTKKNNDRIYGKCTIIRYTRNTK